MLTRDEIQEIFDLQIVEAINTYNGWFDELFALATYCDRVIDFKAFVIQNLNERQNDSWFGRNDCWNDLPNPITDWVNVDAICELILSQLPKDRSVRLDWEHGIDWGDHDSGAYMRSE